MVVKLSAAKGQSTVPQTASHRAVLGWELGDNIYLRSFVGCVLLSMGEQNNQMIVLIQSVMTHFFLVLNPRKCIERFRKEKQKFSSFTLSLFGVAGDIE